MARTKSQTQTIEAPVEEPVVETPVEEVLPDIEAVAAALSEVMTTSSAEEASIEVSEPKASNRKRDPIVKILFHVRLDLDAWEAEYGEVPGDSELRVVVKQTAEDTFRPAFLSAFPEGIAEVVA